MAPDSDRTKRQIYPTFLIMKCLTWNLEWTNPASHRAGLINALVSEIDPDVICYTEINRDMVPAGHIIEADADYGYPMKPGRRKVLLWSKHPWTQTDTFGDDELPGGRFAMGVCRGIRFVGVCIPWRDAHVKTGRHDRAPWEDHVSYCAGLGRILRQHATNVEPLCVLGDYNQRIPRVSQPKDVAQALVEAIPSDFRIATAGATDLEGRNLIDHITVSRGLEISVTGFLPRTSEDGTHLSDHSGVVAILQAID